MDRQNRDIPVTDPFKYNKRDILLLLQLLHTNGLINPDSLHEKQNIETLKDISNQWFDHKITKLSVLDGLSIDSPWTIHQLQALYSNILSQNEECSTTTELADKVYMERIKELETKIKQAQPEFRELINQQSEQ